MPGSDAPAGASSQRLLTDPRLLAPMVVCLVVRLAVLVAFEPWDEAARGRVLRLDALEYHQLAENLLAEGRFSREPAGAPEAIRTPVYPVLVAFVHSVAGPSPSAVLVAQVLLEGLACALLFLTVCRFLGARVALFACLFYALDPFLVFYSNQHLSDSTLVLLLVVGSFLLSPVLADPARTAGVRAAALSGAVFGLAALTKPVAALLPVAIVPALLWSARSSPRRGATLSLALVAAFLLALSPWIVRNYRAFGAFGLSTSGSYNALTLYAVPLEMERSGLPRHAAQRALLQRAEARMRDAGSDPATANDFEKAAFWRRLALEYAARDPLAFAHHSLTGAVFFFSGLGTHGWAQMLELSTRKPVGGERPYSGVVDRYRNLWAHRTGPELALGAIFAPFVAITYLSAALGLRMPGRRDARSYLVLCLAVLAYFVLVTGAAGSARFKLPAIPFYLPFAGLGFSRLWSRVSPRGAPRELSPCAR